MAQAENFKLSIPSRLNLVRDTCLGMLKKIEKFHLSESDLFDLRLCIEESLINAVKYGNKLDKNLKVDISVKVDENKVEVAILDQGEGFDYNTLPDPTVNSNILKSSGRGVYLVRHLMDEVRFNDKGNQITLVKYIK